MRLAKSFFVVVAACLVATACADPKESATRTLTEAERKVAKLKTGAGQRSPYALGSVESMLADIKEKYSAGDFETVNDRAPALMEAIDVLENTPATHDAPQPQIAAAVADWGHLSGEVSTTIAFLESRIDILATPGASTQKIDRATLETARADLVALQQTWAEANEEFSSGEAVAAIEKASLVKRESAKLLKKLGVDAG